MNTTATSAGFVSRPRSVWILTILNIIFSGVLPIVTAVAFISLMGTQSLLDLMLAGIQIALGGAVIWFSVGAWRGDNTARKRLLVTIVILHSTYIFSGFVLFAFMGMSTELLGRFLGVTFRSLLWMGVNLRYFRRPETLAWYRSRSQIESAV